MTTTTFALVATVQVYENYAWTDEGLDVVNPFWKAKGGQEFVIFENKSVNEIMNMNHRDFPLFVNKVIQAKTIEQNGLYDYTMLDYELVELSDHLVSTVFEFIKKYISEDKYYNLDDIKMDFTDITEYAFEWAVQKLFAAGIININEIIYDRFVAILKDD